jgi:hypothetical protein
VPDFDISQYLENFESDGKSGTCKACFKPVRWSRDRVASHKRVNCSFVSEEEKRFFAQRKLTGIKDENSDDFGSSEFI